MSIIPRLDRNRVYDPRFPGIWRAYIPADADFPFASEVYGIMCTVGGVVSVRNAEDGSTVLLPIVAGQTIPGRFSRVNATGTTATGIVVGY